MRACAGSNHTDRFLREEELSEPSWCFVNMDFSKPLQLQSGISIQYSKEPHKKPMSKEAKKKFHDDYLW